MLQHYILAPLLIFNRYPDPIHFHDIIENPDFCVDFYQEMWVCNAASQFIPGDNSSNVLYNDLAYGTKVVSQRFKQSQIANGQSLYDTARQVIFGLLKPFVSTRLAPLYIVDTLIDFDHPEFDGLNKRTMSFNQGSLLSMHGTHVASVAVGKTLGTSNRFISEVVGVHVLDDDNSMPWSVLLNALSWISKAPPGTINLSIAGPHNRAVNRALELMIDRGFHVVVAAGNNAKDACDFSPASARGVITVGSLQKQPPYTAQSSFSNGGKCVTMWAPGEGILGAIPQNRLAYMSGTSMAAPQVAGLWSGNFHMSTERFLIQFSQRNGMYGGRRDIKK